MISNGNHSCSNWYNFSHKNSLIRKDECFSIYGRNSVHIIHIIWYINLKPIPIIIPFVKFIYLKFHDAINYQHRHIMNDEMLTKSTSIWQARCADWTLEASNQGHLKSPSDSHGHHHILEFLSAEAKRNQTPAQIAPGTRKKEWKS